MTRDVEGYWHCPSCEEKRLAWARWAIARLRAKPPKARFEVVEDSADRLIIRDRNDGAMSVTNDAEAVVQSLRDAGSLIAGKRLFYWDTQGDLDEILWAEDGSVSFAPGPAR